MSMKKWRQLVNEKAEVEQQNESILTQQLKTIKSMKS